MRSLDAAAIASARTVIVDGVSQGDAAKAANISRPGVQHRVKIAYRAIEEIRAVVLQRNASIQTVLPKGWIQVTVFGPAKIIKDLERDYRGRVQMQQAA
jgi:hypothetical protein